MQETPASPVVLGVMVNHGEVVEAVHVPVPEVRMEPPPPSLVKERVGGSMFIWARTGGGSQRGQREGEEREDEGFKEAHGSGAIGGLVVEVSG